MLEFKELNHFIKLEYSSENETENIVPQTSTLEATGLAQLVIISKSKLLLFFCSFNKISLS